MKKCWMVFTWTLCPRHFAFGLVLITTRHNCLKTNRTLSSNLKWKQNHITLHASSLVCLGPLLLARVTEKCFVTNFNWCVVSWFFCFSYNGAITKCVTAIIVLQRKCKEYQNNGDKEQPVRPPTSVVMGPPPPQVRALQGPGTGISSRSSSSETEPEVCGVKKMYYSVIVKRLVCFSVHIPTVYSKHADK